MQSISNGITVGKPAPEQEIIILGTGPAGLAAAVYAARAERKPLVLAGPEPGGQVALTYTIENYPGFPDGIQGADLYALLQKQAERFGAIVEYSSASSVDLKSTPFRITSESGEFRTRALIVATGASPRLLNIPGEIEFRGKGVSYCATCDGAFFRGKQVMVVGGGDSALEEGLFLTRFASQVTIVHRRNELRAGRILRDRAEQNPKIRFLLETVVEEIRGPDSVKSVAARNVSSGKTDILPADGVFVFIGHDPNTALFRGILDMDEKGYVRVDDRMRTSVPGVFAAGEAADPTFRQVATSAGMGVAAAISAERWLAEQH
ncbi:MAG: thioredoxin-disulfide reductase [Anaerolineales bacterium]|nr:thioredoxin-disulfide reductase [Anaerolineales bacterium]